MPSNLRSDEIPLTRIANGVVQNGKFYQLVTRTYDLPIMQTKSLLASSNSNTRLYVDSITVEASQPIGNSANKTIDVFVQGWYLENLLTLVQTSCQRLWGITYDGTQIFPAFCRRFHLHHMNDLGRPILVSAFGNTADESNSGKISITYVELDV